VYSSSQEDSDWRKQRKHEKIVALVFHYLVVDG
jgi:hypothetical protein